MRFENLIRITSLQNIHENLQIDIIGNLFDLSLDNGSIEGVNKAFTLSRQIDLDKLSEKNAIILNYDLANGWKYLRNLKPDKSKGWNFQMEELTKEIFHLRKAIASAGFDRIEKERQCQIYTNLGNVFSFVGRFVEAQEYWNRAIDILPAFAMAIGNKGNGLFHYGLVLHDDIHKNLFIIYAFHHLGLALHLRHNLHASAENGMQQLYNYLKPSIPAPYLSELPDLNDFDLGNDEELKFYRQWCLQNKLYVNPLNDLGGYPIASHDALNLPTVIIPSSRPPVFLNLYNQIKQEFGTARFAYYYSLQNARPHLSDIDIPLVETGETVRYSFYVEQLKIAFRLAYSILDKIAYLLNDYLNLQIDSNKTSFRTIWYSNAPKMILRPFFLTSENWALRGLYWLSRDLYDKEDNFDEVLEPDAREIATIRNFIEHKGFKVIADLQLFPELLKTESDISYSIRRSEFEKKTLNLLKLTRAAIIYLSLAISAEESKKDYSAIKAWSITPTIIPDFMKS